MRKAKHSASQAPDKTQTQTQQPEQQPSPGGALDEAWAPTQLLNLQRIVGNRQVQALIQRSKLGDRISGNAGEESAGEANQAHESRDGHSSNALQDRIGGGSDQSEPRGSPAGESALAAEIAGTETYDTAANGAPEEAQSAVAGGNKNGYQLVSQAYPDAPELIGEIFFANGDATVFGDDKAAIKRLTEAYYDKGQPWLALLILGYADRRPYKDDADEKKQIALTEARANNVRDRLNEAFSLNTGSGYGEIVVPNPPVMQTAGKGIEPTSKQYTGNNAHDANLARFRRTDILVVGHKPAAPKKPPPQPAEPPKQSQKTISKHWLARVRMSGGAGIGKPGPAGIGVEGALVEIVSADTGEGMTFVFGGANAAVGNTFADASGPTEWKSFTTSKEIPVHFFAGSTEHTNIKLKVGIGGALDIWRLYGPTTNAGTWPVILTFTDVQYPGKEDKPWYEDALDAIPIPQANASNTVEGQLIPQ